MHLSCRLPSKWGIAASLFFALALAACGGTGDDPGEAEDGGQGDAEAGASGQESEDGDDAQGANEASGGDDMVLEPLEDGFPEGPITLWNRAEPGHSDDLLNILIADIGQKYSPVPLNTDSNPSGPRVQYALAEYLRELPDAQEGYHTFAISYLGPSFRHLTNEAACNDHPEDLQPLSSMVEAPMVLAVPPDSEFDSYEELTEWAKENPGELGTVGGSAGSSGHVVLTLWGDEEGIDFRFTPTEGAAEATNVLRGGGADAGSVTYNPDIDEQLSVLAVAGDERIEALPDVPALSEFGHDIPLTSSRGQGTLPEVPEARQEWLTELFRRVAEDPEFEERQPGFVFNFRGPEEVREFQTNLLDRVEPALRDADLLIEDC